MSETSQGDGWWMASDGRWYPPPNLMHLPTPPTQAGPTVHGTAGQSADTVAKNWAKGAEGERLTSNMLDSLPPGWHVFHDLKIPNSAANIDHLVIGPTGIRVIDSKAYEATFTYSNGMLWRGKYPIRKEIATLEWMTGIVTNSLGHPADPVLCFVYAKLPRPAQMIGRARVVNLEALAELLTSGPLTYTASQVDAMAGQALNLRNPPKPKATRRLPPPPRSATTAPARGISPRSSTPASGSGGRKGPKGPIIGLVLLVGFFIFVGSGGLKAGSTFIGKTATQTLSSPTTSAATALPNQSPTTVALAESPRMPVSIWCPLTRGTGYRASFFTWPGQGIYEPGHIGYLVSVQVNDQAAKLYRWDDSGDTGPPTLEGVPADTTIRTTTIALMGDGTKHSPSVRVVRTPPEPC